MTALRAGPYVLTVNSLRRASRAHRSTPEIRRFVILTLLACLATFGLVACGGGGGVPSLSVTPGSASLAVGESVQLTVSGAGGSAASWTSNAETVATVNDAGLVTAISVGQAVVTATLASEPSRSASATITVTSGSGQPVGALIDLDGGLTHTVALASDGSVWTWGSNLLGELGVGIPPIQSQEPQKVGIADVVDIAAGDHFTLALKSDGTVWAWGSNGNSQLGAASTNDWETTPIKVTGIESAVAIDAASSTAMALLDDGTVAMWGANFGGVLGRTTFEPVEDATPMLASGLSDIVAISLGGTLSTVHALALSSDGDVWAWGSNALAALGQPTTIPANATPSKVTGVSDVIHIEAGQSFSVVIDEAGTVSAWGAANLGQLGAGSVGAFSETPVTTAVSDVVAVVAGQQHALALHADGSVSSWGSNGMGRLGIGADSGFRLNPELVPEVAFDVVAAGVQFSLAIDADGNPWGWGSNLNLQLGVADGVDTTSPVKIW